MNWFRRHLLITLTALYALVLIVLHAFDLFPRPGLYDLSRLCGASIVTIEGRVVDFPNTRWGQTRFLLEGTAWPLSAFRGRVAVTLKTYHPELGPGDVLRLRGSLTSPRLPTIKNAFNERDYLANEQVYSRLTVWSESGFQRISPLERMTWERRAWQASRAFRTFWEAALPPREASALLGVTVGGRGYLPAELKAQCIRAGVYHIMVVSGQNVAVLVMVGLALFRACQVPKRWLVLLCTGPLLFFACMVGGDPPVFRAVAMALVTLTAVALRRDVPPWYPFTWAVLLELVNEPAALFGASFQLSFGATACLLIVFRWRHSVQVGGPRLLRWMVDTGLASIAIHIALWPLLVLYFHRLSLIGLAANWSVFPLSSVVMMAGLAVGSWGILWPKALPEFVVQGVEHAVRLLLWLIDRLAAPAWASLPVRPPERPSLALYYATLFGILWLIHRRKNAQKTTSFPARRDRL